MVNRNTPAERRRISGDVYLTDPVSGDPRVDVGFAVPGWKPAVPARHQRAAFPGTAMLLDGRWYEIYRVTPQAGDPKRTAYHLRPWDDAQVIRTAFELTPEACESLTRDHRELERRLARGAALRQVPFLTGLLSAADQKRLESELGVPATRATMISAILVMLPSVIVVMMTIALALGMDFGELQDLVRNISRFSPLALYLGLDGDVALSSMTTGDFNTAVGYKALRFNTGGGLNTAVGYQALRSNTGSSNTAVGQAANRNGVAHTYNTAIGRGAMLESKTGSFNTALGARALEFNTSPTGDGNSNIVIAYKAGKNTAGSDNIVIGSPGRNGSGIIEIGTSANFGNEPGPHTKTYIAGIRGTTTVNNDAIPVLIDSAGQLGTVSSSERFKTDVRDMEAVSRALIELRPVTFRYKDREYAAGQYEYGLIAEEVAAVFPDLVIYHSEGKPLTVRYHLLSTLLLNEFQRHLTAESQQSEALRARLAELEAETVELRAEAGALRADTSALKAEVAALRTLEARLAQIEVEIGRSPKLAAERSKTRSGDEREPATSVRDENEEDVFRITPSGVTTEIIDGRTLSKKE